MQLDSRWRVTGLVAAVLVFSTAVTSLALVSRDRAALSTYARVHEVLDETARAVVRAESDTARASFRRLRSLLAELPGPKRRDELVHGVGLVLASSASREPSRIDDALAALHRLESTLLAEAFAVQAAARRVTVGLALLAGAAALGLAWAAVFVETPGPRGKAAVDRLSRRSPLSDETPPAPESPEPTESGAAEAREGAETTRSAPAEERPQVLVIDDEASIGRSLRRALREAEVEITTGGRLGLERALATPERWDLVLCDLGMPDLDGVAVHEAIREAHPELLERLVFMTGALHTERARTFVDTFAPPIIEKPFDVEEVRAALAARGRQQGSRAD